MFLVRWVGRRKRLSQPPTRPCVCTGGAGNWDAVLLVEMRPRKNFAPTTDSSFILPKAKPSVIGSQCIVISNRNNHSCMAETTMAKTPSPPSNLNDHSMMLCFGIHFSEKNVPPDTDASSSLPTTRNRQC